MKPVRYTFEGYTDQAVTNQIIKFLEQKGYTVTRKRKGKTEIIRTGLTCERCGWQAREKRGITNGKPWHGIFCESSEKSHTKWLEQ